MAAAVMRATAPTHGETARKDLVAFLMMLLHDRSNMPKMHRKIKTFVYSLQVDALNELNAARRKSPGEFITRSPVRLEDLLQRALGCGGPGVYQDHDSARLMQLIDGMSSIIANIDVTKGLNEIYGEKAKKRLRKARQMIDQHVFTMTFVVKDDVIDMVRVAGVTDPAEVERRAQRIWEEVCFTLQIYRTTQGEEGTLAEFMCHWLQSGYSWEAASAHLETLSRTTRKRALSPSFREDAMKRLRANVARTYDPQARQGTEYGGEAS